MTETLETTALAALPKGAANKLRRIDEEIEDLQATRRGIDSGIDRARDKIRELESHLERTRAADRKALPHVRGDRNPARQRNEDELVAEIAKHTRFIERNDRAIAALSERLQPLHELRRAVKNWRASTGSAAVLKAFNGELELPSNSDLVPIRKAIAKLKADIRRVQHAPRSGDELAASLDREIDRLRQAGRPNLSALVDGATDELKWPVTTQSLYSLGQTRAGDSVNSVGQQRSVDTSAVLTWLFPDAMHDALHRELQALHGGEGISAEERASRLATLRAKLLNLERIEETIITTEQPEVPRRADLDLRAFLGLADDVEVPDED